MQIYKVLHNIDNKRITILNSDAEFIHFMRKIAVENEDEDLSILSIGEAKDYLSNYCSNLTLLDVRQPVERIMWESVRSDMKYPIDEDNDGLIYGLNLYDNSMDYEPLQESEEWQDIIEVQWFKTDQEREDFIIENNLRIVFDD